MHLYKSLMFQIKFQIQDAVRQSDLAAIYDCNVSPWDPWLKGEYQFERVTCTSKLCLLDKVFLDPAFPGFCVCCSRRAMKRHWKVSSTASLFISSSKGSSAVVSGQWKKYTKLSSSHSEIKRLQARDSFGQTHKSSEIIVKLLRATVDQSILQLRT